MVTDGLARWYASVENAYLKTKLELEKQVVWQSKVELATKRLSKNPAVTHHRLG